MGLSTAKLADFWIGQVNSFASIPVIIVALAFVFGAYTIAGKIHVRTANWMLAGAWISMRWPAKVTFPDTEL